MRRAVAVVALCMVWGMAQAQTKSDKEIRDEDAKAAALYQQQNFVAVLPLYEDLHKQVPGSLPYQERLAMALMAGSEPKTPAEKVAIRKRARDLLLAAQKAGDNSPLLQTLLEKMGPDDATPPPPLPGQEWFDKAETAFTHGDLPGAVALYAKALEVNPNFYEAATFAGDAEYKLNHPAEAGKWFSKAIAIDPDRETAHRYWGDCLEKSGEHLRAEGQFIEAILAAPYSKGPRLALKQWADANHARIVPPPITLPGRATPGKKPGNINITIDPKINAEDTALALMYSMNSASWQGDKFKKEYPNEKQYRHSLKEELEGIQGMLAIAKEQKTPANKQSTSTKLLIELDNKGLLACWILLDNPDNGIAQDYVAYRKEHRDLLAKYIAQYDVHPM